MDSLDRLRGHLVEVPARLTSLPEAQLMDKPPGKWSRQEILGHLIDSAINNLKRFTDAQFSESPYLIQSYNQDELVRVNQYQFLPLNHLLTLWQSLNRQILYVTESLPDHVFTKQIQVSQFKAEPKTLAWLIDDYVVHLEHHLKKLLQPD